LNDAAYGRRNRQLKREDVVELCRQHVSASGHESPISNNNPATTCMEKKERSKV